MFAWRIPVSVRCYSRYSRSTVRMASMASPSSRFHGSRPVDPNHPARVPARSAPGRAAFDAVLGGRVLLHQAHRADVLHLADVVAELPFDGRRLGGGPAVADQLDPVRDGGMPHLVPQKALFV